MAEHKTFGIGTVVRVREVDGGEFVATLRFENGLERVLQLRQQYWDTDIATLTPARDFNHVAEPKVIEDDASIATGESDGETQPGDKTTCIIAVDPEGWVPAVSG